MDSIAVVVATCGDELVWNKFAERALRSIDRQSRLPDEIIRIHRDSLREARNEGVRATHTDWTIILDADDELNEFYIASMLLGQGDLRYPRIEYLNEDGTRESIIPKGSLSKANFICIGAMFRKSLFEQVGGFGEEPIYEDWALWRKMEKAGAIISPSLAIYMAYRRQGSRGDVPQEMRELWIKNIQAY